MKHLDLIFFIIIAIIYIGKNILDAIKKPINKPEVEKNDNEILVPVSAIPETKKTSFFTEEKHAKVTKNRTKKQEKIITPLVEDQKEANIKIELTEEEELKKAILYSEILHRKYF